MSADAATGQQAARRPGPSAGCLLRTEVLLALAAFAVLCVAALTAKPALVEPDDYAYRASIVALTDGHPLTLSTAQVSALAAQLTHAAGPSRAVLTGPGGPFRSGYLPGEITFSLTAVGPNLRYMPAHLIRAMPMLVLGLAALAAVTSAAVVAAMFGLGIWAFNDMRAFPMGVPGIAYRGAGIAHLPGQPRQIGGPPGRRGKPPGGPAINP